MWSFRVKMNSICMQDNLTYMGIFANFWHVEADDVQKIYVLLRRGFERRLNSFSPSALKLTLHCIQSLLSVW